MNSLAKRFAWKLCMGSSHSCHNYGTWGRKEFGGGGLKLSYGGQATKGKSFLWRGQLTALNILGFLTFEGGIEKNIDLEWVYVTWKKLQI